MTESTMTSKTQGPSSAAIMEASKSPSTHVEHLSTDPGTEERVARRTVEARRRKSTTKKRQRYKTSLKGTAMQTTTLQKLKKLRGLPASLLHVSSLDNELRSSSALHRTTGSEGLT